MQFSFPGFPPEAMTFFRGLKRNNKREWFQARKAVFDEKVRAPMFQLVDALNAEMMKFAPDYVTEPERAIYRIYRDTRFSSDKTPYKTHIAAVFPRRGMERHAGAGFYFSVSPQEVEVAGGVYMPPPEQLSAIRSHLAEHHEEFRRIANTRSLRTLVGEIVGDRLARVPKGFCADHPAADLVRYKQLYVFAELDPALARTPKLLGELVKHFRVMTPLVEFLNAPLIRARRHPPRDAFFV
jgi:uncharacterized protein (TIGR02453 family)